MGVEKIWDKIDKNGSDDLTRIGGGHYRDVYRLESEKFGEHMGQVVKIARGDRGRSANAYEFSTWMTVKGTANERYFCPIRHRSQNLEFIVMDYAEPCVDVVSDTYELSDEMHDVITEVFDVGDVPLDEQGCLDIVPRNIGIHDTKGSVLIDYSWGGDISS